MNSSNYKNSATMGSPFSPMQPAFYEHPSQYVPLAGTNLKQPRIAVCLCPVSEIIGPVLSRHSTGNVGWGQCPSNMCDRSVDIKPNIRFGTKSCKK